MTAGLSLRAHRLAELIGEWPRARVPLLDLWRLLDKVDPASRTDGERRSVLARLLDELASAEVIGLPSARSYDRTELPPLPRFVTVTRPNTEPPVRRDVLWHPELSWVPAARLAPSQMDQLALVNAWLFRHRDDLIVPVRERSLEIFGDEKALDRLLPTNLFAQDRLSLSILRSRRAVPRMFTRAVGDGDAVLVVENSDTFDSLVRALIDRVSQIGVVGWGSGAGFEASVLSLLDLDRPVSQVWYFGDLDRAGLRIPANASEIAAASGLPTVRPAVGLYSPSYGKAGRRPVSHTCPGRPPPSSSSGSTRHTVTRCATCSTPDGVSPRKPWACATCCAMTTGRHQRTHSHVRNWLVVSE